MEQSLGKRIAHHRKRLGLTQDQLAEKLGVTAQAVSKWENDQSCPDISILPQLAQIFGISVDALLGRETKAAVNTCVVEETTHDESESEGVHIQKGDWEFRWDSGRRDGLALAFLVLLVGVLTFVSRLYEWDVSFWQILWPSMLLVHGLKGIFHTFSFFRLGCFFFGGYFLVDNLGFWRWEFSNDLIFPSLVILFGVSLAADALRKPKKPRFRVTKKGGSNKTKIDYSASSENFDCSLSFGEDSRVVSLPRLSFGEASVSFGTLTLDLSGCAEVSDNCRIEADCSFGNLILQVPSRFRIEMDSDTAFGTVNISGSPDPAPAGIIYLDASASFGEITVQYI